MTVRLNHTIVRSRDKHESAAFVARILGLGPPQRFGHFVTVATGNDVSLDFDDASDVQPQHYAFLVDDEDFAAIFERVKAEGIDYFADPAHQRRGELNARDGGRGFYFSGPDGHNLEVLTRPYGSGGARG
ncbi:MAG TPA: VOC family protein [Acidimicrobiales bacterium]|nr:VOC family protein [Acidimicrobiales bacterium]